MVITYTIDENATISIKLKEGTNKFSLSEKIGLLEMHKFHLLTQQNVEITPIKDNG